MSLDHIKYLNHARNISMLSDYKQHHIGAILVYRRQIISIGYNVQKTHVLQKEYNKYRELNGIDIIHKLHAEIMCLSKVKRLDIDFNKCILYIFRQHKNKNWALSKPCSACFNMLLDVGINKICYTIEGGYRFEHYK